MNDYAIHAEGLSKLYHIGSQQKQYDRIGEQLAATLRAPFRRAARLLRGRSLGVSEQDETIWALKDVSFEIRHGEVVGIIGRNGAGKSTLLKIMSRITDPTGGYAEILGRVGSLLEVGTGFHPELTGRENIYLNGAILGMKKGEIDSKLDEIIAFAEIDKFIDTPVKHYSSGMYVRLAFSVAAHLEPEILLVDEVLAVGDVAFQNKCLGKMDDVARQGRTVLFVSHNMGVIQALCHRGILLKEGAVTADGPVVDVVDTYLSTLDLVRSQDVASREDRRGQGKVRLVGVEVCGGPNQSSSNFKSGDPVTFVFHVNGKVPGMNCDFFLYDHIGQPVAVFKSKIRGAHDRFDPSNPDRFTCVIDELLLLPGHYRIDVVIKGDNTVQDSIEAVTSFNIAEGLIASRPTHKSKKFSVSMPHRWTFPVQE